MADTLVRAGESLQAAIDTAGVDDVLLLEPATYQGQFTLKSNLTIRTAGEIPERRIAPADGLARIVSGHAVSPFAMSGLVKVKLVGLDFAPNVLGESDIIQVNDCVDVDVDRCRMIVPADQQQKRFMLGNGRDIRFRRFYIANQARTGQESHAFNAWNGAGPYLIEDGFAEVAGINILFGGADSQSPADVPSDITVVRCDLTKKLEWQGQDVVVKNLIEFKSARRFVVRDSLLMNCWQGQGQDGTAIMLTPVNQNGSAPWSCLEDGLFERLNIRNVSKVASVIGYGYNYNDPDFPNGPTGQTTRITIRDCFGDVHERGFFVANENGVVQIYRNAFVMPVDSVALSLDKTVVWAEGAAQRPAQFAAADFTWAENDLPGYIHSQGGGIPAYTLRYSLTVPTDAPPHIPPVPPVEPEEPEQPPTVDPLDALALRIEAAEAVNTAQTERLEKLLLKLRSLPPNAKVQQVVQALRSV